MNVALHCSRCGRTAVVEVLFLFDIPLEANRAGWSLDTITHSSGRLVSADLCPDCLHRDSHPVAARTGAVRTSLPFHTYSPASGEQTTSIEQLAGFVLEHKSTRLCRLTGGATEANAPKLATPPTSESQPAKPRPQETAVADVQAVDQHETNHPTETPIQLNPTADLGSGRGAVSDESAPLAGGAWRTA